MSTTKPRITITLDPHIALQLKRLSELTKTSQSAFVSDLLEQSMPVLSRMVQVLEAAELAKNSLKQNSIDRLEEAQKRIEGHLGLVLADFDQTMAPLEEQAHKVRRRATKGSKKATKAGADNAIATQAKRGAFAAAAPALTPLSNRGVRSTQIARKNIAINDGSAEPARKRTPKNKE